MRLVIAEHCRYYLSHLPTNIYIKLSSDAHIFFHTFLPKTNIHMYNSLKFLYNSTLTSQSYLLHQVTQVARECSAY